MLSLHLFTCLYWYSLFRSFFQHFLSLRRVSHFSSESSIHHQHQRIIKHWRETTATNVLIKQLIKLKNQKRDEKQKLKVIHDWNGKVVKKRLYLTVVELLFEIRL